MAAKAPKYKAPAAYSSQYTGQINGLLGQITNRQEFAYNPLEDASYQALAKIYNQNGIQAANDTMGQAAALNGGYGSSYAVTAAQQQRNDYNQKLAAMIPELEQNAYQRYYDNYNMNISALDALQGRDDSLYGRYRDRVADSQWLANYNYTSYRDKVSDSQWQKEFNLSKKSAAGKGGRGGRRRRSSRGGGGYYSSGYGSGGGSSSDRYTPPDVKKYAVNKVLEGLNSLTGKKGAVSLAKATGKASSKSKGKKK